MLYAYKQHNRSFIQIQDIPYRLLSYVFKNLIFIKITFYQYLNVILWVTLGSRWNLRNHNACALGNQNQSWFSFSKSLALLCLLLDMI